MLTKKAAHELKSTNIKSVDYNVPEGYEIKGDLVCPLEKKAVADPAQTILITGHSGAGKSTLAKALAEKFAGVVEDDIGSHAAVICSHCLAGDLPIKLMKRSKSQFHGDSGWQFVCGNTHSIEDGRIASLGEISKKFPEIKQHIEKQAGTHLALLEKTGLAYRRNNGLVKKAAHELKSTNIKSVDYNKENNSLDIEFHSGGTYTYEDVPKSLFDRIRKVKSPGKFFHKHIKKDNKFAYNKLEKEK